MCVHKIRKNSCKVCFPEGHLVGVVGCRIRSALLSNKTRKTIEYLGISIADYRDYLENLFEEGTTWDNYGKPTGWQIDHITPLFYKKKEYRLL